MHGSGAILLLLVPCLPACVFDIAEVTPAGDAGVPGSCEGAGVPPDPANRTINPSFEETLTGWDADSATLSVVAIEGAPHGCSIGRVTHDDSSGDSTYEIKNDPRTINESVAGATYWASARVRSSPAIDPASRQAEVAIRILESDSTIAESARVPLGSSFTEIQTSGVAGGGLSIGVRVIQYDPVAGDAFDVDLIQLGEGSPGGRQPAAD